MINSKNELIKNDIILKFNFLTDDNQIITKELKMILSLADK